MSTHVFEVIVVVVHSDPDVHNLTAEGVVQAVDDAAQTAGYNVTQIIRRRVPQNHVCSLGLLTREKDNQAEATDVE